MTPKPGQAYRLKLKNAPKEALISFTRFASAGGVVDLPLPHSADLGYIIATRAGAQLDIESACFEVKPLGPLESALARARASVTKDRGKIVRLPDFSVFATGTRLGKRIFRAAHRHAWETGAPLEGPLRQTFPELWLGWPAVTDRTPVAAREPAYAISLHLYHPEVWPEIEAVLRRLEPDFDLIVTTVPGREAMIADIGKSFPRAEFHVFENRGRDVAPFLRLLERGRFDRYPYLCKIHGKSSRGTLPFAVMGALWRRRLLFDTLAAPGVARAIRDRFEANPRLGLLGPRAYRYPNAHRSLLISWGPNEPGVSALAARMGVAPRELRLDFFGGSMFWFRPDAFRPLRALALSGEFAPEAGAVDGALEHFVERLFTPSTRLAGYEVEDIDGAEPGLGAAR